MKIRTAKIPITLAADSPDDLREILGWKMARYVEASNSRAAVLRSLSEEIIKAAFTNEKQTAILFRHPFSEPSLRGRSPVPVAEVYRSALRNALGHSAIGSFPLVRSSTVHDSSGSAQRQWRWGALGSIDTPDRSFLVLEGTSQRPNLRPGNMRTWINHEQMGLIVPVSEPFTVRIGGGLKPIDFDGMYAQQTELPIDSNFSNNDRPARSRRIA